MRPNTLIPLPAIVCATLLALPAGAADLYKWVDAKGVTNYSSEPPPGAARDAKKFTVLEDRVSVYTPDKQLQQAIEATRQRALEDLRTGRRERELEAEHLARLRSAPSEPAWATGYDPCLDAANVDLCNNRVYNDTFPYYAAAPIVGRGGRFRFLRQPQITPGTTAGNVVGMNSAFIPGYSAFVPGTMMTAPPVTASHPGRSFGKR